MKNYGTRCTKCGATEVVEIIRDADGQEVNLIYHCTNPLCDEKKSWRPDDISNIEKTKPSKKWCFIACKP